MWIKSTALSFIIIFVLMLSACGSKAVPVEDSEPVPTAPPAEALILSEPTLTENPTETVISIREESQMHLMIGETDVFVRWEDNESVDALKALAEDGPLTISMSMYGGFEQVGSLGTDLPRNDTQTVTKAGDIVLYLGNQIVLLYGSNSWSYTRLGRITDLSEEGLIDLLGNDDVTLTISY